MSMMDNLTHQWRKTICLNLQLVLTTQETLTPEQRTDVTEAKSKVSSNDTQTGMKIALKYWRSRNPVEATFRALLLILLSLLKGDIALKVCKYMSDKCKFHLSFVTQCTCMCSKLGKGIYHTVENPEQDPMVQRNSLQVIGEACSITV